jgi:hypothetical protein
MVPMAARGFAHAPASIDRHMTAANPGLTSGLPRVVEGLSDGRDPDIYRF